MIFRLSLDSNSAVDGCIVSWSLASDFMHSMFGSSFISCTGCWCVGNKKQWRLRLPASVTGLAACGMGGWWFLGATALFIKEWNFFLLITSAWRLKDWEGNQCREALQPRAKDGRRMQGKCFISRSSHANSASLFNPTSLHLFQVTLLLQSLGKGLLTSGIPNSNETEDGDVKLDAQCRVSKAVLLSPT